MELRIKLPKGFEVLLQTMAADAAEKAVMQCLDQVKQEKSNENSLELFSLKQAAKYLSISPSKLYELRRDDDLPSVQIGPGVRILKSDLDEYVMSKRSIEN